MASANPVAGCAAGGAGRRRGGVPFPKQAVSQGGVAAEIMGQALPDWPKPPACGGIEWVDEMEGNSPKSA